MKVCSLILFLFLFASTFMPNWAEGASSFYPGFKTVGVWVEDKNLRLDMNVWYPSVRRASDVSYAPWELHVARNGKEADGRFPLLLLSHDSSENRFSHHETAALLARSGFIVASPTHNTDNSNNIPYLFSLRQLVDRVEEMRATLDVLLVHPDIGPSIDANRVGVLGFGVGGTTALLLGGGLLVPSGWDGYCSKVQGNDPYCTAWAAPRMRQMAQELPLKKSLADVRIKAVAVAAPAYGMFFNAESLRWLYPPLLIIKAEQDTINRAPLHADVIRAGSPVPPDFFVIKDAEASTLMSACPPALQKDISALCGEATAAQRRVAHKQLNEQLNTFFLRVLGNPDNLPRIPLPPDLTPVRPQEEIKEKQVVQDKKKRSRGTKVQ